MAEAFEDAGDAVEAFAAGVHARQQVVELVGDALLLRKRGEYEGCSLRSIGSKSRHIQPVTDFGNVLQKPWMLEPIK